MISYSFFFCDESCFKHSWQVSWDSLVIIYIFIYLLNTYIQISSLNLCLSLVKHRHMRTQCLWAILHNLNPALYPKSWGSHLKQDATSCRNPELHSPQTYTGNCCSSQHRVRRTDNSKQIAKADLENHYTHRCTHDDSA